MVSILDAVNQVTQDARIRAAMLLGGWLESGDNPAAVGDNGSSFGTWQLNQPSHPNVDARQALDPLWAARFMEPTYAGAVAQVPASQWQTNPEYAAERAVYLAERPAQDYFVARGKSTVDSAWKNTVAQLSGQDVTKNPNYSPLGGNPPNSSSQGDSSTATASTAGFSLNPLTGLKDLGKDLERIGFISVFLMVGAAMIVLGLTRATGYKPQLSPALAAAAL